MRCPECGCQILPFGLSARQVEVLRLVSEGYTNKRIADALGISDQTVKNHLHLIYEKFHAHDRTHAVLLAIRAGLIEVGPNPKPNANQEVVDPAGVGE